MNNLSSRSFFVFALTVLLTYPLFSQTKFPDKVPDPISTKDQFSHQFPDERYDPDGPFSKLDFRNDHQSWLEKGKRVNGDYRTHFESKRPPQPAISKQMLDSVWVNDWKHTYTYDANGNMTERISQDWENNAWVNSRKETYTYNSNGNRTEWLYQEWNNNAWVNIWKSTYTYDTNGNMMERLRQYWQNSAWMNGAKETYTYDANGNMFEELRQYWDGNAWVNNGKNTYTYDANGNITERLGQGWGGNAWWNVKKHTYTYDTNGNMTEELWQDWENNAWVNYRKYTYTYDNNGNMLERLVQVWRETVAINDEKNLPEVFKLSQNYPNPFNPTTTIQYELPQRSNVQIVIYDLLGRKVTTLVSENQDAGYKSVIWDAINEHGKPVSAGVYLYQIQARLRSVSYDGQAGEYVQTKKMVVLK